MSLLITCEFAGKQIPDGLPQMDHLVESGHFVEDRPNPAKWKSDAVSLHIGRLLSQQLTAPLLFNPYSSQLIDVTKSLGHPKLFTERTRDWPPESKQFLINEVHSAYRERVRRAIRHLTIHFSPVIHLSLRTFPLKLGDRIRRTDVGLLYDSARDWEADFCADWVDELYWMCPNLKVRRNYPRRGTVDSLTKAMRGEFPAEEYLGIDVWFNRAWVARPLQIREDCLLTICRSLAMLTRQMAVEAA
ncbi:N-formylglutamate amidohydrolase [Stieleria varia]|uniref:N-formylglutamate amidohydrolase n=1 Tax=Stieleria varia TaxID=2528005 RepID=A0A5C5ZWH4_9BACT|nr:N-formylglutamate amidohydrolase [Stieleria varia]TWT91510.1 N-formylglutamate amidohydrolase [Stieleria varia]